MAQQPEGEFLRKGDTRTAFIRSLWSNQLPDNLHALRLEEGKYLLAKATSEQSATGEPTRDLLSTLSPLMPGEFALIPLKSGAAVSLQIDRRPDSTIMISRNAVSSYTIRGSAPMPIQLNFHGLTPRGIN